MSRALGGLPILLSINSDLTCLLPSLHVLYGGLSMTLGWGTVGHSHVGYTQVQRAPSVTPLLQVALEQSLDFAAARGQYHLHPLPAHLESLPPSSACSTFE